MTISNQANDNPMRVGDIKLHNEKIILESIFLSGEQGRTQTEIISETGLRAPTVLRFFSELESNSYIIPLNSVNKANSIDVANESVIKKTRPKGRPPVKYIVNKDRFYIIGIEFRVECASIAVFDFLRNRLFEKLYIIKEALTAEQMTQFLANMISEAIKESKINSAFILGVGVGAPGRVHVKTGTVLRYPHIVGMNEYPLAAKLKELTGFNIYVSNNCSVLALNEAREGIAKNEKSLFIFLLRSGVNGTFINNGVLYTNSHGSTIETGHIPVSMNGPKCSCGSVGCLEAWFSELNGQAKGDDYTSHLLFSHLEEALKNGDVKAKATLKKAAQGLYVAMRTITKIYKPDAYLFVGISQNVTETLAYYVRQAQIKDNDSFDNEKVNYYTEIYTPSSALKGAMALVLDAFFSI